MISWWYVVKFVLQMILLFYHIIFRLCFIDMNYRWCCNIVRLIMMYIINIFLFKSCDLQIICSAMISRWCASTVTQPRSTTFSRTSETSWPATHSPTTSLPRLYWSVSVWNSGSSEISWPTPRLGIWVSFIEDFDCGWWQKCYEFPFITSKILVTA